MIELMITLSIIAVLVRIAMPAYGAIRRDSLASQAAGDFNTIRAAAVAQYEATGSYPADSPAGVVPHNMAAFLPHDFQFTKPAYTLDWDNFSVADSAAGGAMSGQILAITVTARDSIAGLQILHTLGANCSHWSVGNSHTFVVQSTLESPR
jgi:type II secretory pathway pseudopilin PulG